MSVVGASARQLAGALECTDKYDKGGKLLQKRCNLLEQTVCFTADLHA